MKPRKLGRSPLDREYLPPKGIISPVKEQWREYPFDSNYLISNMGRVSRLSGSTLKNGYRVFGSKGKNKLVSRAVLETFVGSKKDLDASHLNGNPSDNRLENLKWETRKDNNFRKFIHKTQPWGQNIHFTKLKNEDVIFIFKSKDREVDLAKKYGVTPSAINRIRNGKRWAILTGGIK